MITEFRVHFEASDRVPFNISIIKGIAYGNLLDQNHCP